jgi:hypothetical protein
MEFELTLVVIGTDYIGNCKSNYHTIMTKTIPNFYEKDLKQNYILNLDLYTFSNKKINVILFCKIWQNNILPALPFLLYLMQIASSDQAWMGMTRIQSAKTKQTNDSI